MYLLSYIYSNIYFSQGLNIELIHLYPPIAATVKNGNIKGRFETD